MNIISSIQNGDTFVFEQILLQWQAKVYHYFLKRTKNGTFAEELTQLTFIKLWDYRHTLTHEHSLETQLFRIARTTMIDGIRERARHQKALQQLAVNRMESDQSYQWPAVSAVDISGALNALPPVRKKVFLLNRYHGYSYKEIAREMSLSDRTVEKHISLALKQLKQILRFVIFLFWYLLT